MNKNVLVEQINSNFQVLPNKPANVLKRIKGVVSDNKSNRNGRIYPMSLWQNVVNSDYVKEMINNHSLFGEADHPETRLEISLQNVSHAINDLWIEGDKVMAIIDILPTPMGKIISELLDYGTNIGISSRGAGTVLRDNSVDPDDYQFVTFDFVARPSCEAARLNTILESASIEAKNTKDDEINNLLESYKSSLNENKDEEVWKLDITVNGELNYSNRLSIKQIEDILEHAKDVKPLPKDFYGDEEGTPFNRRKRFDDGVKISRKDKINESDFVPDEDPMSYFDNGKFNYRGKEYGSEEDFWADYEYDLAASKQANTDEDKLDRAIDMAISENIGNENSISGLILSTKMHYCGDARAHYDGDATDEEIADKLKHELENRGFDYIDDLLESIRDSYINDTVKELLS